MLSDRARNFTEGWTDLQKAAGITLSREALEGLALISSNKFGPEKQGEYEQLVNLLLDEHARGYAAGSPQGLFERLENLGRQFAPARAVAAGRVADPWFDTDGSNPPLGPADSRLSAATLNTAANGETNLGRVGAQGLAAGEILGDGLAPVTDDGPAPATSAARRPPAPRLRRPAGNTKAAPAGDPAGEEAGRGAMPKLPVLDQVQPEINNLKSMGGSLARFGLAAAVPAAVLAPAVMGAAAGEEVGGPAAGVVGGTASGLGALGGATLGWQLGHIGSNNSQRFGPVARRAGAILGAIAGGGAGGLVGGGVNNLAVGMVDKAAAGGNGLSATIGGALDAAGYNSSHDREAMQLRAMSNSPAYQLVQQTQRQQRELERAQLVERIYLSSLAQGYS